MSDFPTDRNDSAGPPTPLDPNIEAIIASAKAKQADAAAAQAAAEESEARWRRALHAWQRVREFRGDAIPDEIDGDALHRRYAELIVELGRVLKEEGWGPKVEAVTAESDAKKYAIEMLHRAMAGDVDAVSRMVQEGVATLFHLGLSADRWLREGLMNEVLNIRPTPEPPPGWKGPYAEPIETIADVIRWIDQQFVVQEQLGRRPADASDGRLMGL